MEHLYKVYIGADVLSDPFLDRTSSSQLQVLPEESYHAGMRAITSAIESATREGRGIRFVVEIKLFVTIGEPTQPARGKPEEGQIHN